MRVGNSYDLHNLIVGSGFKLGGIFIAADTSIKAISDGDILLHTISEAIIGALGLGDLGDWFDENNINIDSTIILLKALMLMREKKYQIINIDATIVLDEPKLKKYKEEIKINLQKLLQLEADQINIKATTSEHNFTNFIQAYTTVLLTTE